MEITGYRIRCAKIHRTDSVFLSIQRCWRLKSLFDSGSLCRRARFPFGDRLVGCISRRRRGAGALCRFQRRAAFAAKLGPIGYGLTASFAIGDCGRRVRRIRGMCGVWGTRRLRGIHGVRSTRRLRGIRGVRGVRRPRGICRFRGICRVRGIRRLRGGDISRPLCAAFRTERALFGICASAGAGPDKPVHHIRLEIHRREIRGTLISALRAESAGRGVRCPARAFPHHFFPDIFDSGAERAVRIQFPEDEISDHQNASENGSKLKVKDSGTFNHPRKPQSPRWTRSA